MIVPRYRLEKQERNRTVQRLIPQSISALRKASLTSMKNGACIWYSNCRAGEQPEKGLNEPQNPVSIFSRLE
jgi:hypothetical protein